MTEGLSRRDLVAFAGAGLALSAYKLSEGKALAAPRDNARPANPLQPYPAPCEPHGYDANTEPNGGFFPYILRAPYICVIHINFLAPWKIWINYASFSMNGVYTDEARLAKAKKVLLERLDPDNPVTRFSKLRFNRPYNGRDRIDFTKFGFRKKHELFFFFENPNISLDKNWLAVFTKLSNQHPTAYNDENYSFIYARIVSEIDLGPELYSRGRMFRMRNYAQDEHGNPATAEEYSMNIHFKIPCGGNEWVPMVIDPDTGNGAGHEP